MKVKKTTTSVPPKRHPDVVSLRGKSPAPVPLYPYQQRWVKDTSRFKIVVKSTQIGYSFAAALEAVLDCLEHRTLWIVLSRGLRRTASWSPTCSARC